MNMVYITVVIGLRVPQPFGGYTQTQETRRCISGSNTWENTLYGSHRSGYVSCVETIARELIAETAIEALMRNFPDETRQAIEKLF